MLLDHSLSRAPQAGVHWLVGLYENGLNGILGDEMGLGNKDLHAPRIRPN